MKIFAVFDINCAQCTHVLNWSTYFDTFGHSLVRKHQIAQFLHQLCSVCLNKVHILIYMYLIYFSYGAKASNSTIVAVLTSSVATVHKSTYFDIFDPSYGPNALNSTVYLLYLASFVVNVHKKVHILTHLSPVMVKSIKWHSFCCIWHRLCSVCLNEVHILIYLNPVMV